MNAGMLCFLFGEMSHSMALSLFWPDSDLQMLSQNYETIYYAQR